MRLTRIVAFLVILAGCSQFDGEKPTSPVLLSAEELEDLTTFPTAAVSGGNSTSTSDRERIKVLNAMEEHGYEFVASRSFSGPSQFPPKNFAAYGILAFPANPQYSASTRKRFIRFCEAYSTTIYPSSSFEERGVPKPQQMVTVLPISSDAVALAVGELRYQEGCQLALNNYGLVQAQRAIEEANQASERTDGIKKLSGRGPFLIAWSPASDKGATETVVLVADLTNSVSREQIAADMRLWVETIQLQPDLWRKGWNLEGLRLTGQRWIDRRATGILEVLGDVL